MRLLQLALILMVTITAAQAGAIELKDPTRPPKYRRVITVDTASQERQKFVLNAIKITPVRRSAIVNGQVVTVGESIGVAEVIQIEANTVTIEYRNEVIELALLTHRVKSPALPRQNIESSSHE